MSEENVELHDDAVILVAFVQRRLVDLGPLGRGGHAQPSLLGALAALSFLMLAMTTSDSILMVGVSCGIGRE